MIAGNKPEPQHRCSQHRQPSLREILLSRNLADLTDLTWGDLTRTAAQETQEHLKSLTGADPFKARKHSIPPLDKHPGKALALLATPVFSGRSLADLIGNAFMKSHL